MQFYVEGMKTTGFNDWQGFDAVEESGGLIFDPATGDTKECVVVGGVVYQEYAGASFQRSDSHREWVTHKGMTIEQVLRVRDEAEADMQASLVREEVLKQLAFRRLCEQGDEGDEDVDFDDAGNDDHRD